MANLKHQALNELTPKPQCFCCHAVNEDQRITLLLIPFSPGERSEFKDVFQETKIIKAACEAQISYLLL